MIRRHVLHPTIFHLAIAAIISAQYHNGVQEQITVPAKIGPYRRVKIIKKTLSGEKYGIGVYKKSSDSERFLIKIWTGRRKDSNYYDLLAEYHMYGMLGTIIGRLKRTATVRIEIPQAVDLILGKGTVSAVFSYIQAKPLYAQPLHHQRTIMGQVLNDLQRISRSLTSTERHLLPKRTFWFYLFSLPFFTILTALRRKTHARLIIRSWIRSILYAIDCEKHQLILAHRDLWPENILVSKGRMFLIDCSRMTLTLPGYDRVNLSIRKEYHTLLDTPEQAFLTATDHFLKTVICMQQVVNQPENPRQNTYLQLLSRLYEKN